jgi:single-stranded DNA-binding protein
MTAALGILPRGGGRQCRRRGPGVWVRVALFGDAVGAAAARFTKGYREGRLTLETWTGRDGEAKGAQPCGVEVQSMRRCRGSRARVERTPDEVRGVELPFL